jgi:hypothetical protein
MVVKTSSVCALSAKPLSQVWWNLKQSLLRPLSSALLKWRVHIFRNRCGCNSRGIGQLQNLA